MVQKIEEIIFSDNYDIKQTQLSVDKGDTIILKVDQEKIDFDIAIIGCGAYAFPLGAYVKKLGKKAIDLLKNTQKSSLQRYNHCSL